MSQKSKTEYLESCRARYPNRNRALLLGATGPPETPGTGSGAGGQRCHRHGCCFKIRSFKNPNVVGPINARRITPASCQFSRLRWPHEFALRFMTTAAENSPCIPAPDCQHVTDIARVRVTSTDQQPSRDAKVLPDRKIRHVGRDQTNPLNKSLTGIFRRPC